MVSTVIPVQPFDLVIFGATGDLAKRKILPSLYRRMAVGQMPPAARVVGAARSKMTRAEFRKQAATALEEFVAPDLMRPELVEQFLACIDYVAVDATGGDGWAALAKKLDDKPDHIRAFYLSVAPSLFAAIADKLAAIGVATPSSRIVVEKPLGHDLASARALNAQLSRHFAEEQIYRIDHYLGKETVQNLMAIRFANALFEPLWNARYVDHVQITVAENIGVAGRGEYYDKSGAMRDMVQNHMMQLLCLTAMEPPAHFEPNAVRDEKLKVIRSLDPLKLSDTCRGQYRANGAAPSYLDDVKNPMSRTESFVALRVHISNWRWAGTPFYLRTGKRLGARLSEIVVVFRDPPHSIFPRVEDLRGNALIIRLQPDEGITMRVTIKDPGPGGMRLTEVPLDMTFADALGGEAASMPEAYERLIMDVIRGDQTLFMRGDEVEAAWAWTDPIIRAWSESGSKPAPYDPGGAGPIDAYKLTSSDGHLWREIARMIEVARQAYPDRDTLMRGLAELVADQLRAAHASKHHAEPGERRRVTLAVPGGTTPGPFLAALSEAELAWNDVDVLPTDERLVPETSERANSRLIRATLLQNAAAGAHMLQYHPVGSRLELVLDTMRARVAETLPIDVLVLGMGADMHTASLFPGAPGLAEALAPDAPPLVRVAPPGQPEARLTLSAPALRRASVIHILITGLDKLRALDAALEDGTWEAAPVRAVLSAPCPVTVHYAD